MELNDIINKIVSNIRNNPILKNVDTRIGTVLRDAIIAPISSAILDVYNYVDSLFSKNDISKASGADLDAIAETYGITRRPGSKALGLVRFYARPQNNTSIVIPAGTIVYGYDQDNKRINFQTLYTGTISQSSKQEDDINNPFYGYKYFETMVEAVDIGSVGNVIKGFINYTDFAAVDGVTNINDFTNGQDEESDDQLRERITRFLYSNYGTIKGYEYFAFDETNAYDVAVITPNDSIFARKDRIGAVDIVLIPSQTINIETTAYIEGNKILLPYKPIEKINFIYYFENNQMITINPSEYSISLYNPNDINFLSPIDSSYIVLNNNNYNGKIVYVNYSYYKEVYDLYETINSFEYKIIGTDVLVRRGLVYYLIIDSLDIYIKLGYSIQATANAIKTSLVNFINSTKLGGAIQLSDIIETCYVDGVDYVSDTPNALLVREDKYIGIEDSILNNNFNFDSINEEDGIKKYQFQNQNSYYNIWISRNGNIDKYSYIRSKSILITNLNVYYSQGV
jgi:uncharacterized phage protein gp47/JayE